MKASFYLDCAVVKPFMLQGQDQTVVIFQIWDKMVVFKIWDQTIIFNREELCSEGRYGASNQQNSSEYAWSQQRNVNRETKLTFPLQQRNGSVWHGLTEVLAAIRNLSADLKYFSNIIKWKSLGNQGDLQIMPK